MRLYADKIDPGSKWRPSFRITGEHGMRYGLFWSNGRPLTGDGFGLNPELIRRVILERYPNEPADSSLPTEP